MVEEPAPGIPKSPGEAEEPKKSKERESTPPPGAGGLPEFDFEGHRKGAVDEYARKRDVYERFASDVHKILKGALEREGVLVLDVNFRAKTPDSFGRKAATRSELDPSKPKYSRPLEEITDLAGIRVIAFFPSSIPLICKCIENEFDVVERVDLRASLMAEDRFGYQSVHYIVKLATQRSPLPEYGKYGGLKAEIQVRTVMQHAWAEIEHGIQYKSPIALPQEIHRRLLALAGMLEVADREFEGIRAADEELRRSAAELIDRGQALDRVELTPDALSRYLDKRLRPDARVASYSYDFETRHLRMLGFSNLAEVDECIHGLDDDKISRALAGGRLGQLSRFRFLVQAGMGENYIARWRQAEPIFDDSFWEYLRGVLEKLRKSGVETRSYSPPLQSGIERSSE